MGGAGLDFAFRAETTKNLFISDPAFQQLYSYLLFEIPIRARREIDSSHSSLANLANDHVCSDTLANFRGILARKCCGKVVSTLLQFVRCFAKKRLRLR